MNNNLLKNQIIIIFLALILMSFLTSIIYWLDLGSNIKYLVNVLLVILLIMTNRNSKFYYYREIKYLFVFIAIIVLQTIIIFNFSSNTIQNFIGLLFIFSSLLIFSNIEIDINNINRLFFFFAVTLLIQFLIITYQSLILKLDYDRIGGGFGRAGTSVIGIIFSFLFVGAIGSFVFLKKRKPLYLSFPLVIGVLIMSEVKAGYIFIISALLILPLFPTFNKKINVKAFILLAITLPIIYFIIFYIFPIVFGNYFMTDVLTNYDKFSEYYASQNYYDARLTRIDALFKVSTDFFKNPTNTLFGYGLGSTSISTFSGTTEFNTQFGQLLYFYSMASDLIFYLIQFGILGTALFILLNLYFMFVSFKISKTAKNNFELFLCYLSFGIQLILFEAFLFYSRPYTTLILPFITYGIFGLVLQIRRQTLVSNNE